MVNLRPNIESRVPMEFASPERDCPCAQFPNGDCEVCKSPEAAQLRQRESLAQSNQQPPKDIPITRYLPYRKLKKKLDVQ